MNSKAVTWIWEQPDWPHFHWQEAQIGPMLRRVRLQQGILLGKAATVYHDFTHEIIFDNLLLSIISSSSIEGEQLNIQSVRSALAKKMGCHLTQPYPASTRSEGLAKIALDSNTNLDTPMTLERIFQWHQCLFVNIENPLYSNKAGQFRLEDMQIISVHSQSIETHFKPPLYTLLEKEMAAFINWFNQSRNDKALDPFLRAAICYFWFITLHPFDDGNGRITRALTDLILAQDNRQVMGLYSISATILARRSNYYQILEETQHNTADISLWLVWFLEMLENSLQVTIDKIDSALAKNRFQQRYQQVELSTEQIKVLNGMVGGTGGEVEHGLSASLYQTIANVSKATATRHLSDLLIKGFIEKLPGGGRNTRYQLKLS